MMKLTILGMNGPFPAPGGATSGYLVKAGSTALMLDMGSGTLQRLTGCMPPEELTALVLSHWHYDHCSDVLPLIYRMESHVASGGAPLHVYAPVEEGSLVRQAVKTCQAMILHDVQPGDTLALGEVTVAAFAGRHPVPALMYRLESDGRTLCYTGDTNTVEGLADFASGADLLLADGLFTDALWAAGKPHLSASLAAKLAAEAGAGKLVITHLNPAIDPETLLREARAIRTDSLLARIGDRYEV
ncbi:MAG: MBL fold metallo-hydrolase [Clostridia bacterium]|nr:MBL fold metallo-hydrolase [Clostridia bacterium]